MNETEQPTPGEQLPNGAKCLAVFNDGQFGIVLAGPTPGGAAYATWLFNVEQGARSTSNGHYFINEDDWETARQDFLDRIKWEMGKP